MVAFQKVEYGSNGQLLPPRTELMALNWEPNGSFTKSEGCWHRHTVIHSVERKFKRDLDAVKVLLAKFDAEVFKVNKLTDYGVDIFYAIEDKSASKAVDGHTLSTDSDLSGLYLKPNMKG